MIYLPKDGGIKPPLQAAVLRTTTTDYVSILQQQAQAKAYATKKLNFCELAAFEGRRNR
jgi:hypothetical protein